MNNIESYEGVTSQSSIASAKRSRPGSYVIVGIVVGILSLCTLLAGGFFTLVQHGMMEIRDMGPWPGPESSAKIVADVDLSHLGLAAGKAHDARDEETWAGGSYTEGVLITYESAAEPVVFVWALRYEDTDQAGSDYSSVQELASNYCGLSSYANLGYSGVIHCQFSNGYQKLIWNNYWIVNIVALEGTEFTPEDLVNKVRDTIAAHWETMEESAR